jgi:predicted nucleic acid-binding Zn ribbon protein
MLVRDKRGRSPEPERMSRALDQFKRSFSPRTPLAEAQSVWPTVVGERIAGVTEVVEEVEGVLHVECRDAVWSQELALMEPGIRQKLDAEMGSRGPREIRFRTVS